MIDQNLLPFSFKIFESRTFTETCLAIKTMIVRGAGAIGAAAGFAMAQAYLEAPTKGFDEFIHNAKKDIESTRPTARNLFYAVERVYNAGKKSMVDAAKEAQSIADENIEEGRKIGEFGNELVNDNFKIATHCNAGWLAFVDYGTALSVVYAAHNSNKNIFVYADETRPRSQGARLTAWELFNENIPHKIIPDNAGAYLMSKKEIDIMIVGADRVAANGDVANKIGTLEKAVAAKEFGVPFYVAAPYSTIDLNCQSGDNIIIEERSEEEVLYQSGLNEKGEIIKIQVSSPGSGALNPAFDVTPAKFINGIITDRGIFPADKLPII